MTPVQCNDLLGRRKRPRRLALTVKPFTSLAANGN
jgi:hypothetical protein